MMLDFLTIAAVCVFIVDISGWTESWRGWLARRFGVQRLRPLRPFDCSLCLTWWSCLVWAAVAGSLSLRAVACAALAAALTPAMLQAWNALEGWLLAVLSALILASDKLIKR